MTQHKACCNHGRTEEKPLKQQRKHLLCSASPKTSSTADFTEGTGHSCLCNSALVTFNCTCPLHLSFQPMLSALGYIYFLEQCNHVLSSLGDKIRNNLAAVFQISLNNSNVRCPKYEPEI